MKPALFAALLALAGLFINATDYTVTNNNVWIGFSRQGIIDTLHRQPTELLPFASFKKIGVIGHWVTSTDLYGISQGDTISLTKMKYDYNLYTWGKFPSGMEFKSNNSFVEYKNVMCSTESSEERYYGEIWNIENGNIIVVRSSYREMRLQILKLTQKKMLLNCIFLKFN